MFQKCYKTVILGLNHKIYQQIQYKTLTLYFLLDIWQIGKEYLPLQQQTYPASRKNSALRVSLFFIRIRPLFPKKTVHPFLSNMVANNRIYYVLSIIQYLLQTINPSSTFATRLKQLIGNFPEVNPSAMGFPKNWEEEPLWKQNSLYSRPDLVVRAGVVYGVLSYFLFGVVGWLYLFPPSMITANRPGGLFAVVRFNRRASLSSKVSFSVRQTPLV